MALEGSGAHAEAAHSTVSELRSLGKVRATINRRPKMRAQTITTIKSRPRRRARHIVLALALGVCALAIPAIASAQPIDYSSVNAISGDSSDPSQPVGGSDYSSVNSITADSRESSAPGEPVNANRVDPTYSSLNAITEAPSDEPTFASDSLTSGGDEFNWGDAAIGAGAAMALLALGGAVFLTVRRPKSVQPARTTG
jgi:hypothetical protein